MLKFASKQEALQHLSDITGKRVKIAADETPEFVDRMILFTLMKSKGKLSGYNLNSALKSIETEVVGYKDLISELPNGKLSPSAKGQITKLKNKYVNAAKMLKELVSEVDKMGDLSANLIENIKKETKKED
jgi:hypothetical protein